MTTTQRHVLVCSQHTGKRETLPRNGKEHEPIGRQNVSRQQGIPPSWNETTLSRFFRSITYKVPLSVGLYHHLSKFRFVMRSVSGLEDLRCSLKSDPRRQSYLVVLNVIGWSRRVCCILNELAGKLELPRSNSSPKKQKSSSPAFVLLKSQQLSDWLPTSSVFAQLCIWGISNFGGGQRGLLNHTKMIQNRHCNSARRGHVARGTVGHMTG